MKKIIKYLDKPLIIISVILFAIGLIMVFSASNVTAYMSHAISPYYYFIKQAIFLLGGLILSIIMICFPVKAYSKSSKTLMLVFIGALLLLPYFGVRVNNATSWYDLKIFSLQPSEFIKVITIVWMASYYEKNAKKLDKYIPSVIPIAVTALIAGLIFKQPDLGTTIIYASIVFCIYLISPIKRVIKYKTICGLLGFSLSAILIILGMGKNFILDRQLERITDVISGTSPCEKLLTSGNQVCNGYIAINNGGLTGVGLGNSTQKYLYLPEPYTDFIFTIIVEELGLIVGILIIILYMILLHRILKIGRESYSDKSAMMCFGIASYIFVHIAVNLLGLFGLIPMTGVPLPFMSYGGSFTICLIASLTIVQRISIENKITKEKLEKRATAKR